MAKLYGMEQLEYMLQAEVNENTKKGLSGEKEIMLMLKSHLPSHAHVIHNPTLLHYEADILIIEEQIGFMFVEVKTWNPRFITQFHPNGSIMTFRDKHNPLKQAENYRGELKSILSSYNSIRNETHQLISSVVIFNGICKDEFLRRPEVRKWDQSTIDKFLMKHLFFHGDPAGIYYWMRRSKKFSNSKLSNHYEYGDILNILEILVQDDNSLNTIEKKESTLPVEIDSIQTIANSNTLVGENEISPLESVSVSKKKNELSMLFRVIPVLIIIFFILYGFSLSFDNMNGVEELEQTSPGNERFVDLKGDEEVFNAKGSYNYFILADSQYIKLTDTQLYGLTKTDLRIARNEIYARHGYVFESEDLQQYFASQAWYTADESYDSELSEIEKYNVNLIYSLE